MSNGLLKSFTSLTSHAKISQVSQEIGWIFGELDALPTVALKRSLSLYYRMCSRVGFDITAMLYRPGEAKRKSHGSIWLGLPESVVELYEGAKIKYVTPPNSASRRQN